MERYKIGLVPGPVSVPAEILTAWKYDYASSDLESEFFALYHENQLLIQKLLHTQNKIIITSGEAMSILWGALKCTLRPGEKMLAVSSGLFGEGFAAMARSFGVNAEICGFDFDEIPDPQKVYDHAKKFRPKIITAVHCETPSGTLTTNMAELQDIAHELDALLICDMVSSFAGVDINFDPDIALIGSQKCLSLTPSLSVTSISQRAWEVIHDVNYSGYEAYKDWENVPENKYMPYTHDWNAMKALHISLSRIMNETPEKVFSRHSNAAKLCRDIGRDIGLKLFPKREEFCSPTVTAFYVPEKYTWREFDSVLRERGLTVGGNYGALSGKVFRVGHMGSQADNELVRNGMRIIGDILH